MDRIYGAETADIGADRRGFKDENVVAGVAGTEVTAHFLNAAQEELMTVIVGAGLVPDPDDWTQLWQALPLKFATRDMLNSGPGAAGNIAIFKDVGLHTFEVPDLITEIRAEVYGGGSSARGILIAGQGGLSGGGGGYSTRVFKVVPGEECTIEVGAGGEATSGTSFNPGGTSSFVCDDGNILATGALNYSTPGAGFFGSINMPGNAGSVNDGGTGQNGGTASGPYGGPGGRGRGASSNAYSGLDATLGGGGGAGNGTAGASGGAGGSGLVVVTW